jgi:hypothetical protein
MKTRMLVSLLCGSALALGSALGVARESSAAGAEVYIVSPKDGARVKSPVTVVFGVKGMGIAPAGIKFDNTGHHHLLVDAGVPTDLSLPIAANEHSLHFGKGQTETSLTLTPGKHTLQLIFGDSLHVPHDPALVSKKITINVQ